MSEASRAGARPGLSAKDGAAPSRTTPFRRGASPHIEAKDAEYGDQSVTDRVELLEAALEVLPDGVGLFGREGEIMFWNQAAQGITGYPAVELVGYKMPESLESLLASGSSAGPVQPPGANLESHRSVAKARHKLGHLVPVIANAQPLHNRLGERIGAAVFFHPIEGQDALPLEGGDEGFSASGARVDLLERLQIEFDDFMRGGAPLGVLRIAVDQAQELRKTHGAPACHAMLKKVYRALARGLRPGEEIGYWGNDGFLVIAHERSAEMFAAHAEALAGLARIADFRWWGDRVSVTVSIGAAQAESAEEQTLAQLLERARRAMETSNQAGGNRATLAARGSECSPS